MTDGCKSIDKNENNEQQQKHLTIPTVNTESAIVT